MELQIDSRVLRAADEISRAKSPMCWMPITRVETITRLVGWALQSGLTPKPRESSAPPERIHVEWPQLVAVGPPSHVAGLLSAAVEEFQRVRSPVVSAGSLQWSHGVRVPKEWVDRCAGYAYPAGQTVGEVVGKSWAQAVRTARARITRWPAKETRTINAASPHEEYEALAVAAETLGIGEPEGIVLYEMLQSLPVGGQ